MLQLVWVLYYWVLSHYLVKFGIKNEKAKINIYIKSIYISNIYKNV